MKNWKTNNPKESGEYLCIMDNAYIKMCHWNGNNWSDMWKASLDGKVKEWTNIPQKETETKEVIDKLNEALKDPEYRIGWVANIAMAQIDCERWYREEHNKVGKYLNYQDRLAIANKGAEYFLELLDR